MSLPAATVVRFWLAVLGCADIALTVGGGMLLIGSEKLVTGREKLVTGRVVTLSCLC